jgi:hypothetical protein
MGGNQFIDTLFAGIFLLFERLKIFDRPKYDNPVSMAGKTGLPMSINNFILYQMLYFSVPGLL